MTETPCKTKPCFVCKGTKMFDGKPCGMCYGTGVDPLITTPELPEGMGIPVIAVEMMHRARNALARLKAFDTAGLEFSRQLIAKEIEQVERELFVIEHLARGSAPAMSDPLMKSWDKVSSAINRMILAQPSRMTEAAEKLREAQAEHQELIIQESRRVRS